MDDRFTDFNDETRDLVLEFERTILKGGHQFFDVDELEIILDYYIGVSDTETLAAALDYAEELYPDSLEIKLRRSHWHALCGHVDTAINQLRKLYRQYPENSDIAYSLGVFYSEKEAHLESIEWFTKASQEEWQLGPTYYNIAEEYYKLHDYSHAIEYYLKTLQIDPLDTSTLYNYTDTCILASLADEALQYIRIILADHPYYKEAWHCMGLIYRSIGLSEKAIDAFEYVIAIDPRFEAAYIDLAQTFAEGGMIAQAASTLSRSLQFSDSPVRIYILLGQLYLHNGNIPTTMEYLRKAKEEDSDNPSIYALSALANLAEDDISLAITNAKKALSLDAQNPDALFAIAVAYDIQGKHKAAQQNFDALIESPQCTEEHCRQYLLYLFGQQRYDDIIDFAIDSLELYPHDPFYSTYLAASYFLTNRYNSLQHVLPDTDMDILNQLCPTLQDNPHLSRFIKTLTLTPKH